MLIFLGEMSHQYIRKPVFRIRILKFLGLPDPDPLVRVTAPNPNTDSFNTKQK
jgi:hypothetical protein